MTIHEHTARLLAAAGIALVVVAASCGIVIPDVVTSDDGGADTSFGDARPPRDGGVKQDAKSSEGGTSDRQTTRETGGPTSDVQTDDAGLSLCGDELVNEEIDEFNCGKCGHACLGLGCVAGVCQTGTVAVASSSNLEIESFVVIGTTVYFIETAEMGTQILSVGTSAGTVSTLVVDDAGAGYDIATDNAHLYWIDGLSARPVKRAALDGSNITVLGSAGSGGFSLAASQLSVYWSTSDGVSSCSTTGCLDAGPRSFAISDAGGGALALDPAHVYWATGLNGAGTAFACPIAGCPPSPTVLGATDKTVEFAAYDGTLYWGDETGKVFAASSGGSDAGAAPVFVNLNEPISGIAADMTGVYWSTTMGTIGMCPLSGCNGAPTVLVTGQKPMFVATDTSAVYWINTTDTGSIIRRVAK